MAQKNEHKSTGQTRVLAIHDICGVGKCSLTAALPILSAAGAEACALPTAIFSTHTAFSSFVSKDMTDFLMPMASAIKEQNFRFDAIIRAILPTKGKQRSSPISSRFWRMTKRASSLTPPWQTAVCFTPAFPPRSRKK